MIAVVQTSSSGNNAIATFCANDIAFDLFPLLGGNPAMGGIWTDTSGNVVSNIFDPTTTTPGTYTYSVTSAPCPSSTADLMININSIPTITISGTDTICIGDVSELSFLLSGFSAI